MSDEVKAWQDFWDVGSGDKYTWNTRLRKVREVLLGERGYQMSNAEKEEIVREALMRFQSEYHFLIMRWANEAQIGPGFVVD